MTDKFTTVSVDHEEREVVATTINGETGEVINVHVVGYNRTKDTPDSELSEGGKQVVST